MKNLGIGIILVGLLITIFIGFNFVTKKKVVDLGDVQITKNENHRIEWSPFVGVGIIVIGGILVFYSRKNMN